jgi:5-methylcytosine-specific restriction endonuclease McrA
MNEYKTCNSCGQNLSVENFYLDRRSNRGYQAKCKDCGRKYREQNRERILARQARYYRENKELWQKSHQLNYEINREFYLEKSRAWRAANPERARAQHASWRQRNPEKHNELSRKRAAKKKGNGVYRVSKKELKALLADPCFYCGGQSNTIDHVVPIARGGGHSIGNLVGACKPCNSSKKDLTIMEWRKKKGAA